MTGFFPDRASRRGQTIEITNVYNPKFRQLCFPVREEMADEPPDLNVLIQAWLKHI